MFKKDKSLSLFLIKKYLSFDKDQPFISLSAILAYLGISLGVGVLIIAMAIMSGFEKEFKKKLFVMNYPLTVIAKNFELVDNKILNNLKKDFKNLKLSPYIRSQALVKTKNNMQGAIIFGIDFKAEKEINEVFKEAIKNKSLEKFEVIIGNSLFNKLNLKNGDKITYIFTKMDSYGLGFSPIIKKMRIKTNFDSGLKAYDNSYVYTTIDSLRKILRYKDNKFDGIHIYSNKPKEDKVRIQEYLGKNFAVFGWWEQNGNFFAAIELEKKVLFIVLMLIILVACLNIISSLLMTVMNRRSEIALLLSLGASSKEIKKTFLYLGIIIGIFGIITGVLFGFFGLFILDNFNIISLPIDVYGTSKLPLNLSSIDLVKIIIGAFVIIIASSYYPAKKASETNILNTLRNE